MPEDLVILVHGTFAHSTDDHGPGWWQCGSLFWEKLNRRLSGQAHCSDSGEVFHWSGKNLETERRQASHDLADLFLRFEEQQRPYHVIAHSHGGNVLLAALFLCRGELKFLRSWATVGTPYFRYHRRAIFHWKTLLPFSLMIVGVLLVPIQLWSGLLLALCGALLTNAAFDQAGPLPEMQADERFRERARKDLKHPWLALWSREDEAITGLTSIAEFRGEFLPRASHYEKASFWEREARRGRFDRMNRFLFRFIAVSRRFATRCVELLLIPIRNRGTIPFVERKVTTVLRKLALGDDTYGSGIVGVSPSPFDFHTQLPALPDTITDQLVQGAEKSLAESRLMPQARGLLAKAAFGGATPDELRHLVSQQIKGGELVHTRYFERDEVVELLAAHIEKSRDANASMVSSELQSFLDEFYEATGQGRAP